MIKSRKILLLACTLIFSSIKVFSALEPNSLVYMGDGTYKRVDHFNAGDKFPVYDEERRCFVFQEIVVDQVNILEDGTVILSAEERPSKAFKIAKGVGQGILEFSEIFIRVGFTTLAVAYLVKHVIDESLKKTTPEELEKAENELELSAATPEQA